MNSGAPKVFLVYIPCHSDYQRALETALKIRSQYTQIQDTSVKNAFEFKINISVNGVNIPTEHYNELEKSTDFLNYFSDPLGGDTNINQGFLKALEIQPDYFWILSANEFLVDGSINFILNSIMNNYDSDLYVTNSMNRSQTYSTSNVFIDIPPGSGYGLISSVIYNFEKTRGSFSAGPKFAWTGWGQLAVLQTACNILGSLKVTEYPDVHVYHEPFTDVRSNSGKTEFEFVRSAYAHSYFGMPILIFALFGRNRTIRNRVLFAWLEQNWFKMRYFKKGAQGDPDPLSPQFDSKWIQKLASRVLLTAGPASLLLSSLGIFLRIEKVRELKKFGASKRKVMQA
ncbi:hypothetical protein MCEMRH37_00030 [Candidatus Nanopelagicaceae bacterium]